MRIEIRNGDGVHAVIITFDTKIQDFDSDYDRNKFFRGLHGWKQTVPSGEKKYFYRRNGLLDEVPHIKVADSAFIVAMENMKRVLDYFDEWSDKVDYEIMEIMMSKSRANML